MAGNVSKIAHRFAEIGRRFDARGWVLGTSGNFSVVLDRDPLRLAITASGAAKGDLTAEQIIKIDDAGRRHRIGEGPTVGGSPAPHRDRERSRSGRRAAHALDVEHAAVRSACGRRRSGIEGFEMLKGLEGVKTHEHSEWIPVLANDQDMTRLAGAVRDALGRHPASHAFLLRRHGMYTWGETLSQAVRHVEIVEFLLEAVARTEEVAWRS